MKLTQEKLIECWRAIKESCGNAPLDIPGSAEHTISYDIDGVSLYGHVEISMSPADSLLLQMTDGLFDGAEHLEDMVIAGILDEPYSKELMPLLGCLVTISNMVVRPESAALLYYYCARECVRKVLGSGCKCSKESFRTFFA